jgi:hypothetical protein
MPNWKTWDYRCQECGAVETHMQDRDAVPDYEYCVAEGCDGQSVRLLGGFVSTSKTSESIPDGTTTRFSKIREQQKAKKALSMAKQSGDKDTANIARRELAKIKRSKS